jgi:hypothetical protein
MEQLTQNQKAIIENISNEFQMDKSIRREFRLFVWFSPREGQFIFDDMFFDPEEIQYLINKKILVFKGFGYHQGEKMVKYVLNKKQ